MVQFRDGSLGFHRRTPRGIPVCCRADLNPVRGASGSGFEEDGIGPEVGAGGIGVAVVVGTGGVGPFDAGTGGVALTDPGGVGSDILLDDLGRDTRDNT